MLNNFPRLCVQNISTAGCPKLMAFSKMMSARSHSGNVSPYLPCTIKTAHHTTIVLAWSGLTYGSVMQSVNPHVHLSTGAGARISRFPSKLQSGENEREVRATHISLKSLRCAKPQMNLEYVGVFLDCRRQTASACFQERSHRQECLAMIFSTSFDPMKGQIGKPRTFDVLRKLYRNMPRQY